MPVQGITVHDTNVLEPEVIWLQVETKHLGLAPNQYMNRAVWTCGTSIPILNTIEKSYGRILAVSQGL
jgi:hypothetical protein